MCLHLRHGKGCRDHAAGGIHALSWRFGGGVEASYGQTRRMAPAAQAVFKLGGAKSSEWMSALARAAMPTRHAALSPDLSASWVSRGAEPVTLAGPQGRTVASHWALPGSAARLRCVAQPGPGRVNPGRPGW